MANGLTPPNDGAVLSDTATPGLIQQLDYFPPPVAPGLYDVRITVRMWIAGPGAPPSEHVLVELLDPLLAPLSPPEPFLNTAPGVFQVGTHAVRDLHDYGVLDLTGVIRKSSNVAAAKIALDLKPKEYFLLTLHRQENVDSGARFASILEGLEKVSAAYAAPVVYPVHPRSRKMIAEFGLNPAGLTLIEPVDFLSFLQLEGNARLILTDSGGIQEEACILRIPCVTLRDNTERPETIEVGANILAGASPRSILECSKTMLDRENIWENPFGDGQASGRIIDILEGKT